MLRPKTTLTLRWLDSVTKVQREDWNALALPLGTPFLEWDWLHNLESSGCATPREGWLAHHLAVYASESLVAIAPFYLKGHSYGEFVFDHQWADLSYRLGIDYYPKLVGMAPLTPAAGYRFLMAPGVDEATLTDAILAEVDRFCVQQHISSCHILFADPHWKAMLEQRGFTPWMHHSYIWSNENYGTFEGYLQSFNANQRRNIKRERKAIANAGLEMKVYTGASIPHHFYGLMYELYSDTCDKFWGGSKYLNRRFFESLAHTYRDRLVFVSAEHPDAHHPVGMSFCIRKGNHLYGRYWGCFKEVDCLHFNACYYTPIEWAIAQGIQSFDPGAGGEHKKRRGFPATPNYSLHRFYRDRLRHILIPHIQEINHYEQRRIDAINQELPFDFTPPELAGTSTL